MARPEVEAAMAAAAKRVGVENPVNTATTTVAPVVPAASPVPPAPAAPEAPVAHVVDAGIPDFLLSNSLEEMKAKKSDPVPPAPVVPVKEEPAPVSDKEINFANMRKRMEAKEAEYNALKQKIDSIYDEKGNLKEDFLKQFKSESPDTEALKKERDFALDRLAKIDLEADPRFQAKYNHAENLARQSILRIAKEYDVDAKDVQNALNMPLKERMAFLNEKLPDALSIIAPHIAKLDELRMSKEMEIDNARQARQQIDQQESIIREKAITEARLALHSQACRDLENEGFFPFKKVPGNEKWNASVDQLMKYGYDLLGSQDAVTQSKSILAGAAAPILLDVMNIYKEQVKALQNELRIVKGTGASISTSNHERTPPAAPETNDPREMARRNIEEVLAKRRR